MKLNVENYLKRISFLNEIHISLGTLKELHKLHIQSVPFENLDIHCGRKIHLDYNELETKIVKNRRGGFCYELNGLFGTFLCQLGFDIKMISARVCRGGEIGREFDHMALIVKLEEEWLVDVGFGDNFLEPIRIKTGVIHQDPVGNFRIEKHDTTYLRLEAYQGDLGYVPKYLFSRTERKLEEYVEMCEYHQTSPDSPFTRGQVYTIATKNGRVTLRVKGSDRSFTEVINYHKTERKVSSVEEYEQILKERFGIVIRKNACTKKSTI
jgi:N-hydroxyarylamine O-acetyltransferase